MTEQRYYVKIYENPTVKFFGPYVMRRYSVADFAIAFCVSEEAANMICDALNRVGTLANEQ